MAAEIVVDVAKVVRGMQKLAAGLDRAANERGMARANATAAKIRPNVPVLTGRLQATVKARKIKGGGEVSYGSPQTPYGRKIERKTHAVQDAVPETVGQFEHEMVAAAEQEIASL
jgi:hypothetical protein